MNIHMLHVWIQITQMYARSVVTVCYKLFSRNIGIRTHICTNSALIHLHMHSFIALHGNSRLKPASIHLHMHSFIALQVKDTYIHICMRSISRLPDAPRHIHTYIHVGIPTHTHIHKHTHTRPRVQTHTVEYITHRLNLKKRTQRQSVSHNCFYYTSKPECAIPDDNDTQRHI
jgi:hypothetical protein